MMAVILAGGKGARLKPFTMNIPKPLLPLGEVPILEVVMRQLIAAGVDRIVLTLGHMPHLFSACVGDGQRLGARVECAIEETPLGTAGPLRAIPDLDENFLVMNGDLLTTLDYRELVRTHLARGAWATVALSRREVQIDYGVVEADETGLLASYLEKPTLAYSVSMGINVLHRRSVEFIPAGVTFDMPQLLLALRQAGKPVACYPTDCYWQDIGRFDDYQQASADFEADPGRFLPASGGASA
jgi:NDP-sugar pyrophosphorylase family protein